MTSYSIWGCIEAEAWAKDLNYKAYVSMCEQAGFMAQSEDMFVSICRLLENELEVANWKLDAEATAAVMNIFMEEH